MFLRDNVQALLHIHLLSVINKHLLSIIVRSSQLSLRLTVDYLAVSRRSSISTHCACSPVEITVASGVAWDLQHELSFQSLLAGEFVRPEVGESRVMISLVYLYWASDGGLLGRDAV